jgi:hypothetical protein
MEFTYNLTEQEFVRAAKLYRKSAAGSVIRKTAFWAFIILCLLLLFASVMKDATAPRGTVPQEHATVSLSVIALQVGPLLLVAPVLFFVIFVWPRMRLRSMYRKTQALQGEISVRATSEAFSIQTSTGSASTVRWSDIKTWSEREDILLLIYPTKVYQTVSLKELSEQEKTQFRQLLTTALPPKK